MFSLLHPAALWALAALALPLAIHLRRPPPRTVRLGSLRFLENVPRRPFRNPRWHEILLLWTRLALLAALVPLLAGPRWTASPPAGPRRWVLLDPTAVLTDDTRARWRKLLTDGYESRLLAPGFPAVSGERIPSPGAPAPELWSLLREADAELPAGSTLAVFSPGRLAALRGVRPSLAHCQVAWCRTPSPDEDTIYSWVNNDLPERLEGRSDAHATALTLLPMERTATSRATSVLILHDAARAADGRSLEAAVRAAAESLGRSVNVQDRAITPDAENAAGTDWTFWLSTAPVPGGLAGRAARIVRYAGGEPPILADGFIVAPGGGAADGVRLHQRAAPDIPSPAATTLWTDGQGHPLLICSRPSASRETWELFTRFDPGWNDLPRSAALPAWVRALLFPETAASLATADSIHDRRSADPSQGPPAGMVPAEAPLLAPADQPALDLHWPLWMLAALLFAAERTLSLHRPARTAQAANVRPRTAVAR